MNQIDIDDEVYGHLKKKSIWEDKKPIYASLFNVACFRMVKNLSFIIKKNYPKNTRRKL